MPQHDDHIQILCICMNFFVWCVRVAEASVHVGVFGAYPVSAQVQNALEIRSFPFNLPHNLAT